MHHPPERRHFRMNFFGTSFVVDILLHSLLQWYMKLLAVCNEVMVNWLTETWLYMHTYTHTY